MPRNPSGWGMRPREWRGRWRAYLTVGYENGKAKRKWVYGRTERECIRKLDALRMEYAAGFQPADGTITLAGYLSEWLDRMAREVRASTLAGYRSKVKRITTRCGRVRLADLQPLVIQRWVESIADAVSPSAAAQTRGLLGQALEDAVRFGVIPRNPVTSTRAPRVERTPKEVWTAEEVARFLATTASGAAPYHAMFYTALTTGLRPGELLALDWPDVTEDAIHVGRTVMDPAKRTAGPPKTRSSRRVVPLPGDTRQVLDRYRLARSWDGVDGEAVFTTPAGRRSHHSNITRSLRAWARKASVNESLSMHGLRHTYASMAIAQGMDVAELARRLGHAHPGITLSTYVHFFERRDRRPALSLGDLLGSADAVGGTDGGIPVDPPS